MGDKLFGICEICKDSVKCYENMNNPPCDARNKEIHQKFFNSTDEYGNTEMCKLDLTKEEKTELHTWLLKTEYYGPSFPIYSEKISHYKFRHDKSEYIFKKTGVKRPTPDDFTTEEQEGWYAYQDTQTGVCIDCIVRPNCHEICSAKSQEQMAESFRGESIKAGLCDKCETLFACVYQDNCIERKEEIRKTGK